jgi:hypothetical protein
MLQAELDLLGREDVALSGHAVYLRSPADRGRAVQGAGERGAPPITLLKLSSLAALGIPLRCAPLDGSHHSIRHPSPGSRPAVL